MSRLLIPQKRVILTRRTALLGSLAASTLLAAPAILRAQVPIFHHKVIAGSASVPWDPATKAHFWNPLNAGSMTVNGSNQVTQINDIGATGGLNFTQVAASAPLNTGAINGHVALDFGNKTKTLVGTGNGTNVGFFGVILQPLVNPFLSGPTAGSVGECPVGFNATAANGSFNIGNYTGTFNNELISVRSTGSSNYNINDTALLTPCWIGSYWTGSQYTIYMNNSAVDLRNASGGTPLLIAMGTGANSIRWGEQSDGANNYSGVQGAMVWDPAGTLADIVGWGAWANANYGI